jgi:phospholipid/cholesterol/gamma-HCH transport system substrate-binding protein
MRRAIRKYLGDFLALMALIILGVGVGGYILTQQRLRFPLIEEKPQTVKVVLPDAQAVQPGQGQTVRVAGVKIGDIGKVELEDGRALVELQIDKKYKNLIRSDATALLRTKTGLKDMFIEVDPGTARPISSNSPIPVQNTAPDTDPDEVLDALDTDTRAYLKLLISGAGKGLKGNGEDLREVFKRFEPLHRDLDRVTTAIARRRGNLRRLIHNYGLLVDELGKKDSDLTRLVQTSNATLSAFANEDANVSAAVRKLPGTLDQTRTTLAKVDTLSQRLGPAITSIRPAFRALDGANRQLLPLAREGTPIVRNQIRPFARITGPYTADFGRGARGLAQAGPDLSTSFLKLNRLFNMLGYNPNGAEGLDGKSFAEQRNREEGYLYWIAWVTGLGNSLFNTADGQGVFRRVTLGGVNCSAFAGLGLPPALTDLLGTAGICAKTGP